MRRLLMLAITVSMAFAVNAQQTKEEIQKRQQDLQKEIAELNKVYDEVKKNKKQSLGQLALVQQKLRTREALISNLNKDLRMIDETVYQTLLDINRKKRELDTLKMNYAQSLVFAYKNRSNYDYLNFIFASTSFNDALKRVAYLKSYRQYRETQADAIVQTQKLLEQKAEFLVTSKKQKNLTLKEQGEQLKILEEDKKEKDRVVKDLKNKESDLSKEIKDRERSRQKLKNSLAAIIKRETEEARKREVARVAKEKADAEKKQKEAAAAAAATTAKNDKEEPTTASTPPTQAAKVNDQPVTSGVVTPKTTNRAYSPLESTAEGLTMSLNFENNKGRLPWPVDAGYISIGFGDYYVPGSNVKGHNDGIEIAVKSAGVSVKSVADGEVSSVIDLGGEQAVFVKHGKYFTAYSHLSGTSVEKGQKVKAGTVLGRAAAADEGGGSIIFIVTNEKGTFLSPESWLKRR